MKMTHKAKRGACLAGGLLLLGCARKAPEGLNMDGRVLRSDGMVRLVYEVRGFSTTPEQEAWLRQDLLLVDSEGAIVEARPAVYETRQPVSDPSGVVLENEIRPMEQGKPGLYQAICRVTDLFTLRSEISRLRFRLQ